MEHSFLETEYCNIEISYSEKTLVVNGNRQGVDRFYQQCLSVPPDLENVEFSLSPISRPSRRWHSWDIAYDPKTLPTDPSVYYTLGGGNDNSLANELRVRFVASDYSDIIFYAILESAYPVLIVNQKGWKQFLDLLLYLRDDQAPWFFVVPKNPQFPHPLRFEYTIPSERHSTTRLFWAIECIRLEADPEQAIKLHTALIPEVFRELLQKEGGLTLNLDVCLQISNTIRGNTAGLLFLSQWLRGCASSAELSSDLLNQWDDASVAAEAN